MDSEVNQDKLAVMRKEIMELERLNSLTDQYSASQMQKKINDIIEKVLSDDN